MARGGPANPSTDSGLAGLRVGPSTLRRSSVQAGLGAGGDMATEAAADQAEESAGFNKRYRYYVLGVL
ncbi:MAG: hypothetical protein P8Y95_14375, partial [Gammaproteobacteria bacterium]